MQYSLIIIALSFVATRQQSRLPLLTRLLQPTLFTAPSNMHLHGTLKLTPPPPPSPSPTPLRQSGFSPSPQIRLTAAPEPSNLVTPASPGLFNSSNISESPTTSPLLRSPTTIKFTLNDVSAYFHPQLIPPIVSVKPPEGAHRQGSPAHIVESSFQEESEEDSIFSGTVVKENPPEYQWTLTSGDSSSIKPDTLLLNDSKTGERVDFDESFITGSTDAVFLPSLSFPFLTESTEEPATQTPVETERFVAAASNLQSQPLQFAESSYSFFTIKPIKAEVEEKSMSKPFPQAIKNSRPLSKTPVPKVVDLGLEEINSAEEEITESPPPARRVLQFDQEFLSLLRRYHAQDTETNKTNPSSEKTPFWIEEDTSEKTDVAARIKSELTTALFPTYKPGQVPKTEKSFGGVFTNSIRGLTSTTASDVELPIAGKSSEGLKVIPVGELGEVLHEGQDSVGPDSEVSLSSAFRHGIQSINVSAWVSGCPKLYGKVKLNCAVQHDFLAKPAMTVRWKKKTFDDGRVEKTLITEDNLVMMEDPRLSLDREGSHYNLDIKDFQAKDCGSYECEAQAADTVAASQLLLFTCH